VLVGVDVGTRFVKQLLAGEQKTGVIVFEPYLGMEFFIVIPALSRDVF
jgi:hypothetical protein